MNEVEFLRTLAARTQDESTPAVDVAARVIRKIAVQPRRTIDPRLPLVGLCALALSALAVVATRPARAQSDSLAAFSEAAINSTGPEALLKVFEP